jgi:predicted nucleotidyltransferase
MEMRPSRQDVIQSLKNLKSEVARDYSVKTIGVFGSVARDEQTEQSDIDLLVEFSRPVGFVTFMRLEEYLSDRLGKKVDLVTPDALKPVIRQDVLREVIYV